MKIIALLPVKNDGWFVENSIRSLSHWADHVIVFDEASTDGSVEIYDRVGSLANVVIVKDRPKFSFTTSALRNYMLDCARSFDGKNLIMELHADEVMSAEILSADVRDKLKNILRPKDALMLDWITLWKSPEYYRSDKSVWSNNKCWFGYVDDRNCEFTGPVFHGPRAPESLLSNKKKFSEIEVLHYQFVNLGYERSKQALYQIFEINNYPKKSIDQINKNYAVAFDERGIRLSKLDYKKIGPWLELGLPLMDTYDPSVLNWRDIEVLKNFDRYGTDKYKELNIWYIDWDMKKKQAIEFGLWKGSLDAIADPRGLYTKICHKWVINTQLYPIWKISVWKLFFNKLVDKIRKQIK